METRGSIPQIIRNDDKLYEGNLTHYLRVVCKYARNLHHPYHNLRHMLHVLWLCYQACLFYKEKRINGNLSSPKLTPRQMRNLLIAALFHDFDHSGLLGDDDLNIEKALRALKKHILPEDEMHLDEIVGILKATEFPYKVSSDSLGLLAKIIRDADMSQALSVAWIQQVILGLAAEWRKTAVEILQMQGPFMSNLKFFTDWGQQMFPRKIIDIKIQEANELLELLGEQAPPPAKPA
ncbi:MAG: hypothetical protein Q7S86_03165 [bacterium]|nr:hypothetical protein [bacterium]